MKSIICTLIGTSIGFLAGYFVGKAETEKKNEELKQQLDDYYDISDGYCRKAEKEPDKCEEESYKDQSHEKDVNYAKIYQTKTDEIEDLPGEEKTPEHLANEDHEKNRHKDPEVLSESELAGVPRYVDRQTLFYIYESEDGFLTDEDGERIEDPELLVGTCLDDSGFIDDGQDMIFIRNYQTDCVYQVEKVYQ